MMVSTSDPSGAMLVARVWDAYNAVMDGPTRVVFVVLDAFPHDLTSREGAPHLYALAREGGRARAGGQATLAASTYPNHATFVTGVEPIQHGIFTNRAVRDGELRPAQEVGPAVPTLFDRCRAAGRRSLALFGDQNLVGACGASRADEHWPPGGELPEDAPRGALGYGADRGVLAALEATEFARADFIFMQLDEVDTARHMYGPGGERVAEQCRATDAVLGEILECLRPEWSRTVVIVVSDHDQESVRGGAVDLAAEAAHRGLGVQVDHAGTAALVLGEIEKSTLLSLPGVTDCLELAPAHTLVWGDPGQQFGIDWGLAAQHGSPRTSRQLAIVGGGHPAAGKLARRIVDTRPPARIWAGWVGELLGLD